MAPSKTSPHFLIIGQGIEGDIAPLVSALAHGLHAKGWGCLVRYIGRPAFPKYVSIDRQQGLDSEAITTGKARSISEVWGLLRSLVPICRLVQENRPAAIIFAGFIPGLLYPPLLRLFSQAQFILWDQVPQNTFLKAKKIFFPLALKTIDRIVSVSQSTASAMIDTFGAPAEKITIIPNGIDPAPWQSVPPAPDFSTLRIIMPAECDLNQKDPLTLIKAAAHIREQGIDVEVTLVGSGVDAGLIRAAIETACATDYVHQLTYANDVPALIAKHNVVCLSTKFEGMPTVVIEGMLARRIVVASRVAGCVDLIEDGKNGLLFEAGSVEDCAAKLQQLISAPDTQQIIETAYTEAISNFSPQTMLAKFWRLLGG